MPILAMLCRVGAPGGGTWEGSAPETPRNQGNQGNQGWQAESQHLGSNKGVPPTWTELCPRSGFLTSSGVTDSCGHPTHCASGAV